MPPGPPGWAPCGGSPSGDLQLLRPRSPAPPRGPNASTELQGSGFIQLALLAWCQLTVWGWAGGQRALHCLRLDGCPACVPPQPLNPAWLPRCTPDVDITFPSLCGQHHQTGESAHSRCPPWAGPNKPSQLLVANWSLRQKHQSSSGFPSIPGTGCLPQMPPRVP